MYQPNGEGAQRGHPTEPAAGEEGVIAMISDRDSRQPNGGTNDGSAAGRPTDPSPAPRRPAGEPAPAQAPGTPGGTAEGPLAPAGLTEILARLDRLDAQMRQ